MLVLSLLLRIRRVHNIAAPKFLVEARVLVFEDEEFVEGVGDRETNDGRDADVREDE